MIIYLIVKCDQPFALSFSAPLLKCFVLNGFWLIFVVLRWECPAWLGIGAMLGGPALNRKGIDDASFTVGFGTVSGLRVRLKGKEEKSIVTSAYR